MMEWLAMGGYGAFVWPAYAVTAAVISGLFVWSWRGLIAAQKQEARLGRRSRPVRQGERQA